MRLNQSNSWTARLRLLSGLLMVLVFAAACDSTSSIADTEEFEVTASADAIAQAAAQDLGLTPAGQAGIARSYAQHGDTTQPGFMWRVAASLQESLDADQKARLVERGSRFMPPQRRQRGARGEGPRGNRARFARIGPALADTLGLTAEQRDAIKAVYAEARPQTRALIQQRRDGTLDAEAFREAMKTLRDETEAAVVALLTPEQAAQLEAMKAARQERREERQENREERREATKAVMMEVLGLTDADVDALGALREEHRAEMRDVLESLRGGDTDREAARTRLEALHAEHQAEIATILDETQLETVYIHRALTQIVRKHRADRRGGERQRPGNRRGQGGFGGRG